MYIGQKTQYIKDGNSPQVDLQSYKNPNSIFFYRQGRAYSKMYKNVKYLEQPKQFWGIKGTNMKDLYCFKTYNKATAIRSV